MSIKPLIIITGASSGIGAGTAKIFSEAGYPVGLLARNLDAMEALQLPNAIYLQTDICHEPSVKESIKLAEECFGPVGCLINNAGFGKGGDFTELTHEDHEKTVSVNLMGLINCIETVLPKMRARKFGTIINVSSVADRNVRPNLATYAATKAAVKSLTESLRMANAPYGIRICNIAPAKIKTPLLIQSGLNDHQIIDINDVAKAILWMYEQPMSVCIRDLVIAPTHYEP